MSFTLLAIYICSGKPLVQRLTELLKDDRYCLKQVSAADELLNLVESEPIDCLIIASDSTILTLFSQLYEQEILLPTIIIESEPVDIKDKSSEAATYLYHSGEVRLLETKITAIAASIDQAIAQFLHLGPSVSEPFAIQAKPRQPKSLILTLIDVVAHLGEMYRRSIPREALPWELFFQKD